MVECPRCGGEMREGETFIRVSVPSGASSRGGMIPLPGMGLPAGGETSRQAGMMWREKTGREKGG